MSDEEWIVLVQKLGPKLYRFFLSQNSKAHAEESVQEVFARLLDKFSSAAFRSELGSVEAFAWGIAVNLRKEARRKLRFVETLVDDECPNQAVDPATKNDDLSADLIAMKKAISDLGEPEKTILQCLLADMKISEISSALAMPEGTIKSHIHRAKENVRFKMKRWGVL
ncbi:MAG: sigma-70 family RNA polymerase sigma factor [Bdellovibrionales bacterium]|nr:sigma-70 family RNA polymerase sigma factor [Bdellovibrionales bacterium]